MALSKPVSSSIQFFKKFQWNSDPRRVNAVVMRPLDAEERKARARAKLLHVDDVAQVNPFTKALAAPPKPVNDGTRSIKRKYANLAKRVEAGTVELPKRPDPHSELGMKIRSRQVSADLEDTEVKRTANGVFDIWEERAAEEAEHGQLYDQLGFTKQLDHYHQPAMKKRKLYDEERMPSRVKPSARSAIEVDAAGASYNPEYDAHQELLAKSLAYYTKTTDKEQKKQDELPKRRPVREPMTFEESDDEQEKPEAEQSETTRQRDPTDIVHVNLKHAPRKDKKTIKQEIRQKRRESLKRTRLHQIQIRKTWSELDSIAQGVDESVKTKEERKALRDLRAAELEPTRIKHLGLQRYTTEAPQVLLSSELPGSFRKIAPTTSLLEDRQASLRRRNMIAISKPPKPRKSNEKRFRTVTRRAHKFDL